MTQNRKNQRLKNHKNGLLLKHYFIINENYFHTYSASNPIKYNMFQLFAVLKVFWTLLLLNKSSSNWILWYWRFSSLQWNSTRWQWIRNFKSSIFVYYDSQNDFMLWNSLTMSKSSSIDSNLIISSTTFSNFNSCLLRRTWNSSISHYNYMYTCLGAIYYIFVMFRYIF